MHTSALFGAKNVRFFEIHGVPARTRGIEPVRTFCGQVGSIFRDLVWTSFIDGPSNKRNDLAQLGAVMYVNITE